jgi:acyl dehydratase
MSQIAAFADVHEGQQLPELEMTIDRLSLVKYAGASDDYSFQHWDHPRMTAQGFPDVVAHGWLTFGYMCRAVNDWAPPEIADIQAFAVRYRRPTFPGRVVCGGRVVKTREENGQRLADLDLWARNGDGEVTTTATMTLAIV